MTRPLSEDLRTRVIEAVESGMSRRAAAARFGVAASPAVKWVCRWRETGTRTPRPQGGDKRSHRIEALRGEILALVEERPDITLGETAGHLDRTHDLRVTARVAARVRCAQGPPGSKKSWTARGLYWLSI